MTSLYAETSSAGLAWPDILVIVLYFVVVLGVGLWVSEIDTIVAAAGEMTSRKYICPRLQKAQNNSEYFSFAPLLNNFIQYQILLLSFELFFSR